MKLVIFILFCAAFLVSCTAISRNYDVTLWAWDGSWIDFPVEVIAEVDERIEKETSVVPKLDLTVPLP